jgi:hypothetical protein
MIEDPEYVHQICSSIRLDQTKTENMQYTLQTKRLIEMSLCWMLIIEAYEIPGI